MKDVYFHARQCGPTHYHLFPNPSMCSSLCGTFFVAVTAKEGYSVGNKDLEASSQLDCKKCWKKARKIAGMEPVKGGAK